LLVKKGLVRQLKAFELKRLPKNWNEFWVKYHKTLPCDFKANQKNVMNKILEQQTNLIDGERKFVGDLDVNVFHLVDKKKDWDKLRSKTVIDWENVPELHEDDSDYILAASSDSDNSFMADEDDWSYFGIETVPPNPCHHCQFRGHTRINPVDYEGIKSEHMKCRRYYSEMLQDKQQEHKVSWREQNIRKKFQAYQDASYLNVKTFGKHQGKIATLTKTMKEIFEEQLNRESEIENLQKHLDVLAINEDFSDSYQKLSRKLNNYLITEGAWKEKELIQTKKELDKLRKCQVFSKIARAFMAIGEDPTLANITTSVIQTNSGDTQDNVTVDQLEPINSKNTADSEEFTIGDLSDTNKITGQLQADLHRIEKEFQAAMQTLSSERTAHNQERTSLLNESMEIKKAMIDSKRENDKLREELNNKLQHQQKLIREVDGKISTFDPTTIIVSGPNNFAKLCS
jgi:hypothetical protein